MGFRGARAPLGLEGAWRGWDLAFGALCVPRRGATRRMLLAMAFRATPLMTRPRASPALRRGWRRVGGGCATIPPGFGTRAVLDGETAAGASDTGLEAAREAQAARLHRFYVDEPLPESGGTVYLDRDESRHAVRALRLKPGDALEVCDGRGGVMTAELVGMEGDGGRDAGVAAVASVGEVRRAPFAGRDGTSSPRAEDSREDAPIGSWRGAEPGAASLVPLLTERSPTVGGAERDKSNKEKHGRGEE